MLRDFGQDEIFHPQTCLVAMEPLSNFILLETYGENRYHPFDLQAGLPRQADAVEAALNERFDRVEQLADPLNSPKSRRKLVGKAHENVVNMVATIAYFRHMFWLKMGALNVSDEVRE